MITRTGAMLIAIRGPVVVVYYQFESGHGEKELLRPTITPDSFCGLGYEESSRRKSRAITFAWTAVNTSKRKNRTVYFIEVSPHDRVELYPKSCSSLDLSFYYYCSGVLDTGIVIRDVCYILSVHETRHDLSISMLFPFSDDLPLEV